MKTFKLPVQTTSTSVVEITLPVYRKGGAHFYKVISETECIQVYTHYKYSHTDHTGGIQFANAGLAYHDQQAVDCTEAEFNEAFERTVKAISELALTNTPTHD